MNTQHQDVRPNGLLKLIVGGIFSFAVLSWLFTGHAPSAKYGAFVLISLGLPLVVTFIGLLETLSGRPLQQFSAAWDALAGWQRGVLGVSLVLIFIIVLFSALILFA